MLRHPIFAGLFAVALMLQATCDVRCLTAECKDEVIRQVAVPSCHHDQTPASEERPTKDCGHRQYVNNASTGVKQQMAAQLATLPSAEMPVEVSKHFQPVAMTPRTSSSSGLKSLLSLRI